MSNYQPYAEKRFVYGKLFRIMHWAVAFCFFIAIVLVFSRNLVEDPVIDKSILTLHRSFGLLVMALVCFRLIWRIYTREYPYTGNSPILQFVASISHSMLYTLLMATPFLGWMEASARHKPVSIFGLDLPMLIDRDLELAEQLQIWHSKLGTVFCIVIAVHVFSALWHHVYRRDGVLYSMIPIRQLRKPWVERLTSEAENATTPHEQP